MGAVRIHWRSIAAPLVLIGPLLSAGLPVGAAAPPPAVGSGTPATGPTSGGQVVTISGANFQPGAGVDFGAVFLAPLYVDSNTLRITTPPSPGAAEGLIGVAVTNPDSQSGFQPWRYAYLHGLYTLDGFGGIHPDRGSSAQTGGGYWPNWRIARSAALLPDGTGGYQLDGYGGVHPFGAAMSVSPAYFGWDIARDIALLPAASVNSPQGYTLDGWGGIHPFGAPAVSGGPYWANFDIAKRLALLSDGSGGYVLDGYGGLHPFAVGTAQPPPAITSAYWKNWNIARDVALTPGSTSGNVSGVTLDGFGGLHTFSSSGTVSIANFSPPRYWSRDIARAVRIAPGSTSTFLQGWVLNGYGNLDEFGAITGVVPPPFGGPWPNWDIAVQLLLQ